MKTKLTRFEKAKRQREIVSERRRNGICVICGKNPMGTAEIKATWPENEHRWLLDTLSRLESVGLVESFQWGARRGYRKTEPRKSTLQTDTVKQNEYKAHLRFLGQCYPTEAMIRGVV